jgi:hypothetical protein
MEAEFETPSTGWEATGRGYNVQESSRCLQLGIGVLLVVGLLPRTGARKMWVRSSGALSSMVFCAVSEHAFQLLMRGPVCGHDLSWTPCDHAWVFESEKVA